MVDKAGQVHLRSADTRHLRVLLPQQLNQAETGELRRV